MKNNKILIIVGVILLNVVVIFMISQSLFGKTSQYDKTLIEARTYYEQELCSKALAKYNEVITMKDTLEVRLEMLELYEKGIDIGEFVSTYEIFTAVDTMVQTFREEPVAYEKACELLLKYEKYEECAKILMFARDQKVTSEKIEEYRNLVRYQYMKNFSTYTEVESCFNGMYKVLAENEYTYLTDEASPDFKYTYSDASSFSEEYAFVKGAHPDGKERSFVINKAGERQAYLDGVDSSSGVGRAKSKDGENIYLLSCKIGNVYKYYDINGKEMFGEYAFAGRFRNNVAAVMESEGVWKLIDGTGKEISEQTFTSVALNEFDECAAKGYIFAKSGDKFNLYVYDVEKETVKPVDGFSCDDVKPFWGKYAAFKSGDLWGFVDTTGKVIIEPQYEDAKSFSNSLGAVKIGGEWNFINPNNDIVIQETFEEVDYLNDKGICFVKDDGYWSYLKMYYTGE